MTTLRIMRLDDDEHVSPYLSQVSDERNHHDHLILPVSEPVSPDSGNWSIIEDSEASFDIESQPDTSTACSHGSSKISHGREHMPDSPSTKSNYTNTRSEQSTKKSSSVTPPPQEPVLSALERFLAEDFSDGKRKYSGDGEKIHIIGASRFRKIQSTLIASSPSVVNQVTGSPPGAVIQRSQVPRLGYNKHGEKNYRYMIRRWKVQAKYRNRNIEAQGGKIPDPCWRWCGFPECQSDACRYATASPDLETRKILVATDIGRDCDVLKQLLEAFKSVTWTKDTSLDTRRRHGDFEPHTFVSFATSPPIMRALSDYLHLFIGEKEALRGILCSEYDLHTASRKFEELTRTNNVIGLRDQQQLHFEMRFHDYDWQFLQPSELILRFLMRAEAWRRRQAEESYPWSWSPANVIKVAEVILSTYHQAYIQGYMVWKEMPPRVQNRAWMLWFDRHRPWTDCRISILLDLEVSEMEAKKWSAAHGGEEHSRPDAHVYEGVGRYHAHWWPSQPRAPGVDELKEH